MYCMRALFVDLTKRVERIRHGKGVVYSLGNRKLYKKHELTLLDMNDFGFYVTLREEELVEKCLLVSFVIELRQFICEMVLVKVNMGKELYEWRVKIPLAMLFKSLSGLSSIAKLLSFNVIINSLGSSMTGIASYVDQNIRFESFDLSFQAVGYLENGLCPSLLARSRFITFEEMGSECQSLIKLIIELRRLDVWHTEAKLQFLSEGTVQRQVLPSNFEVFMFGLQFCIFQDGVNKSAARRSFMFMDVQIFQLCGLLLAVRRLMLKGLPSLDPTQSTCILYSRKKMSLRLLVTGIIGRRVKKLYFAALLLQEANIEVGVLASGCSENAPGVYKLNELVVNSTKFSYEGFSIVKNHEMWGEPLLQLIVTRGHFKFNEAVHLFFVHYEKSSYGLIRNSTIAGLNLRG
ncbi:hypothetical protein M0R45_008354 [Rubus argutus]|uniref:Uncharacterized protein n=1 Tax=Rubus argutus TaxID=59490 RepID=A0AAW1Y472_RUBAR